MSFMRTNIGALALTMTLVTGCDRRAAPDAEGHSPISTAPAAALSVTDIEIGNSVGPDKRVLMPMTTFTVRDTIHVSVMTEGAPPTATLTARWLYLGDADSATATEPGAIDSTTRTITPSGPAITGFHIRQSGGWATGNYRAEIFADGKPVGTREFEVR